MIYNLCVLVGILAAVNGKIYFKEDFNDAAWEKRWVVPSDWKAEVRSAGGKSPTHLNLTLSLPSNLDRYG